MTAIIENALAAVRKVHHILESDARNAPRTLQKRIGPSELGVDCDRCLVNKLAGTPTVGDDAPWLPWVGTAVHAAIEDAVMRSMLAEQKAGLSDMDEWIVEGELTVGEVDGKPITGHADLFHVPTGTVIDHKIVGSTTLRKVGARGLGTSRTYQRQAHLYGRGYTLAGHTVRAVVIDFYPRNGMSLATGRQFIAPYDEQVALDALERANRFASWIRLFGAEQVLAGCPPHTGHEFSCSRYADAAQVATSAHGPADFLGVA